MKKLLLVLAVATVFAACNNEEKTPATETPAGDTTKTEAPVDTTAKPAVDTTAATPAVDTAAKK
jgi:PBP1b-binding outer membrane lipoprotein LpoB